MAGDGPAVVLPNRPGCNWWPLTWKTISAQQYTLSTTDPSVAIFKEPHAVVAGTVIEVIKESDGDIHCWVRLDDDPKSRFAVEFDPAISLSGPAVGDHGHFFGIFRYDAQHQWYELHPVTSWLKAQ